MSNFNRTEEARRNRLSAMIDDGEPEATAASTSDPYEGRKQLREACSIRIDRIMPDPDQPRKEFEEDALVRLAESLKTRGQLQPIRVRWDAGQGAYVVVVGERRWRAARMAGLESLACVVVGGNATADEVLEDQLIENALREDLKPVEQARAFQTLTVNLGLTQAQLAAKLQISQTTVSQALSLLELPAPVQTRIDAGELAPSVAYQIAKVEDVDVRAELAEKVVAEKMTRAEAAEAVRKVAGKGRGAKKAKPGRLPAEIKHRSQGGVRFVATTAARHTMADVVAGLEEFLEKLKVEMVAEEGRAA